MEKVLNYYVITTNDEGYVNGFCAVDKGEKYDFHGQMADFPEVSESIPYGGWFKFINKTFVIDIKRKEEIMKKEEEEASKPTKLDRIEAQTFYTAMVTDTLIEEE